ncbi:MAG: Na+/H+ antiporter subunit E [Chlorobiaceae bacterium]|nr:Na+/H+ antiporter subunit E [Chlorobiaceae bacterium]MBA4310216.1 Na+/H+ antiporter subunit E [Chlorobiaceae bacterium]
MKKLALNFILAIVWVGLLGEKDFKVFVEGFIVGFVVIWLVRYSSTSLSYFEKIPKLIWFTLFMIKEIIVANFIITYDIITPKHHMSPAIIGIPLDCETDIEITLLANLITLTPGTLSLDVSKDRKILYIHAVYTLNKEELIREIKEKFEKPLLEILR